MHSNCESMDVFQPTELWKKVIMEKTIWEKKSLELSRDRQEPTCNICNLLFVSIIL